MNTNSKWHCKYNENGTVCVEHRPYPRLKVEVRIEIGGANGAFSEWIDDKTDFAAIVISQFLADATFEAKRWSDENPFND